MTTPIISVIVPYRNEATAIRSCLASLQAQTEPSFEVLLLDDGSADGSTEIAENFAREDERFLAVRGSESIGPSARRNQGLEQATGEFVFFADADDIVLPDALGRLLDLALHTSADTVRGNHVFKFTDGKIETNTFDQYHQPEIANIRYAEMPSLVFLYTSWNMLIRREIILENQLRFEDGLSLGEDRLFTQLVFEASRSIALTKAITYHWIRERGSERHLSYNRSLPARLRSVLAYLELFRSLKDATQMHFEFAQAAMFWELYDHVISPRSVAGLDVEDQIRFATIIDMLKFDQDLLSDPSVKGWKEAQAADAKERYSELQRMG
ncbi:MAG: glycosyltransferase family A protein [Pseudomonadota bacterium]